jgi:hypothetical protein
LKGFALYCLHNIQYISKLTTPIWLPNKIGQVLIYTRVIVSGKRAEIAIGLYIKRERWNAKEGSMKGQS